MLIEPIMGEGGFLTPPPGFLASLRTLCDEHGMLLIFDEVQVGACGNTASIADLAVQCTRQSHAARTCSAASAGTASLVSRTCVTTLWCRKPGWSLSRPSCWACWAPRAGGHGQDRLVVELPAAD